MPRKDRFWADADDNLATIIVNADGSAVSAGGGGGVSYVDDDPFTVGVSSLTPVGGIVSADTVDAGDVGAFAMLANRQQIISIATSAGDVIDSFGGGTQYDEGDTDASITGTAMLMEGAADTLLPVQGTVAAGLLVNLGSNNDVTVTGTVDLGATDNAVLDAIAASVAAADTDLTAIIGHVDGLEGLLATIDADTGGILTAVQTLDNAISGNEMQVDVLTIAAGDNNIGNVDVASIAAGDAVIGRVKLSDGTDVADILDLTNANPLTVAIVDGDGTQITSFGGGTQYTEDAAAAANPVGTATILVRADTPAGAVTTDGDNVAQRGTNFGAAYVQVVDSAGGFIDTFGGSGGTAAADDADFTDGTTQGTPAMGVYESTPTTVTDGDMGLVGITTNRQLKVTLFSEAGAEVAVGGGTQYDEGDTDASITGTAMLMEGAADTLVPVQGTVAAGLLVNLGANNDVTVTGTVDLGATDNAVLDAIAASTAAADTDLTTIIGHVDGLEGLLGTIDADTGGILTAVQLLDDTVAVLGTDTYTETTSKGLIIGAVRRDADTTLVGTTNEVSPLQVDANGRLKVEAFSGETLPVSGTVDLGATDNAVLDAIAASVAASDTDLTTIIGHVDGLEGLIGTTNTNTAATTTALQIMDDWDNGASDGASVSGDVAHGTADAGEPVKIGGKALNADPTAEAANDRVNAMFDLIGKQIVLPYALPESMVSGAITSAMTGTTSTSLIASPGAGLRNYITTIICSNAHGTVGTDIVIQDGSGGTTLLTIPAAAVYGGAVVTLPTPLRQPTTATAIFCANVTTGASTKVSAVGYKGV